jgi:hypothetical protein
MVLWVLAAVLSGLAADGPAVVVPAEVPLGWSRTERCDIAGPNLASLAAPDADACERACAARADCAAFTFISGWDRCQLEAAAEPRVTVRLAAATVVEGELGAVEWDRDHKGADMEDAPRDLADVGGCARACESTTGCLGYSYVDGYRACWLKKAAGSLVPKTFLCGLRP